MTQEERTLKIEEKIKADERTREIAQLEKQVEADEKVWSFDPFNWVSAKRGAIIFGTSWAVERSVVWLLDTVGLFPQDPENGETVGSIVFWLCVLFLMAIDCSECRKRKQKLGDLRKQQLEASMGESATE